MHPRREASIACHRPGEASAAAPDYGQMRVLATLRLAAARGGRPAAGPGMGAVLRCSPATASQKRRPPGKGPGNACEPGHAAPLAGEAAEGPVHGCAVEGARGQRARGWMWRRTRARGDSTVIWSL